MNKLISAIDRANSVLKEAIAKNEHSEIAANLELIHDALNELSLMDANSFDKDFTKQVERVMEDFKVSATAITQLKNINEKLLNRLNGNDLTYSKY